MPLTGFIVQADLNQLPVFSGVISDAVWCIYSPSDGKLYQISANQIAVAGNTFAMTVPATAGSVTNISALHGRSILTVARGGIGIPEVTITGTPNGQQCKWDTVSNDLTAPASNDWNGGELLTIIYS